MAARAARRTLDGRARGALIRRGARPGSSAFLSEDLVVPGAVPNSLHSTAPTPEQALRRLIDGNRRFREGTAATAARPWSAQMATVAQRPFAIVLGCSDSRTPVEILFDQGFGDLFVVRIAGNIVAPSVVGSIEFAASQFGSRLVVVMGHTQCGAVGATLRELDAGPGAGQAPGSKNIRAITDRIAPHIRGLPRTGNGNSHEAIRANVLASADHLRHGSQILEELVLSGAVVVVGAEYELETGAVHFFDGVPPGIDTSV
jgi:carbonic anhydrase